LWDREPCVSLRQQSRKLQRTAEERQAEGACFLVCCAKWIHLIGWAARGGQADCAPASHWRSGGCGSSGKCSRDPCTCACAYRAPCS
jgi:hypothetical protein